MTIAPRRRYAEDTSVTVAKSRTEVIAVLDRYGATERAIIEEAGQIVVMFRLEGWSLRVPVALPGPPTARTNARDAWTPARHDREVRRRWRVLVLVLKAGLEMAVDAGLSVEQAMAAYLVLPDHTTVAESVLPTLREARDSGRMPSRLIPSLPVRIDAGGTIEGDFIALGEGTA